MKNSLILLLFTFTMPGLLAQGKLLGKIDMPNSGATEAQADFIEGMLFLHNFEYDDAARSFQKAQQKDPNFALAYWGEAKTHNHPIWMDQNRDAAQEILNKLGSTLGARQAKAPTQREKDYLMSLEVLYGNTPESSSLTKEERDLLYLDQMSALHAKYPDDHEITTFYGLAILGSAHKGRDFAIYMRAAAELFDVWNANPEHPGAAHYLIHSFDEPIHAPLGLPMARAYSKIAPEASHAQHMCSHIFLALGMWEETITANIVARRVQTTRQKELKRKTTVCGHNPWWLEYGYLQNGQAEEASEVFKTCALRVDGNPTNGELFHYGIMRAHQIIDSENWQAASEWIADMTSSKAGTVDYYFTNAFAAIKMEQLEKARENLVLLQQDDNSSERQVKIKQIEALLLLKEGKTDKAITLLKEAMDYEFSLPIDYGPPTIVKPSAELLGEVYLELGRLDEARQAFKEQLVRTPKRRISLQGLAKVG